MNNSEPGSLRLRVELVPKPLWGKSLANTLPRSRWQAVRRWALQRAAHGCQICGHRPSAGKGLTCHEVWEYDDTDDVQTLVDIEVHCTDCDRVTHFGRTTTLGRPALVQAALARLAEMNGWSIERARQYTIEAREQWMARSSRQWTQNLGWYERWLDGGVQETLI